MNLIGLFECHTALSEILVTACADQLLLLPIRATEIVECVRKYMEESSQNLHRLSSY